MLHYGVLWHETGAAGVSAGTQFDTQCFRSFTAQFKFYCEGVNNRLLKSIKSITATGYNQVRFRMIRLEFKSVGIGENKQIPLRIS